MSKPVYRFATSLIIAVISSSYAHGQTILYVDQNAPGPVHDGFSWCDAFTDIQDALDIAVFNVIIRVAKGTYYPDRGTGDRTATFQLINSVTLKGGFAGCGTPNPDARDIENNETILSGDLDGNDTPVPCTQDSPDCSSYGNICVAGFCIIMQNNDENSDHVVTGSDTDITATLDGFTITAGNANVYSNNGRRRSGGGMLNNSGSPTVANCTFIGNSARIGGGMYNIFDSNPTVTGCLFRGNSARFGGGMLNGSDSNPTVTGCTFNWNFAVLDGGGMFNSIESKPTVISCTFSNNLAGFGGGGMSNFGATTLTNCTFYANKAKNVGGGMCNVSATSTATLTNCTFIGNSAGVAGGMYNIGITILTNCMFSGNSASSLQNVLISSGGGMFSDLDSQLILTNCTFTGNSAAISGGGMFVFRNSPTLINCTFSGNSAAESGGGIFTTLFESNPELTNCILWGNRDEGGMDESAQIHVDSGVPIVRYSIIQGLDTFAGIGNISDDPVFVDADGVDNIAGTLDDDLRLSFGSPAIDAADNDALPPDLADLDDDGDTTEPTPLDLDGNTRFVDDPATLDSGNPGTLGPPVVDMGAYEFVNRCGNGTIDPGEQCDDGNLEDGDLCSGQCQIEGACCDRLDGLCIVTIQGECEDQFSFWTISKNCNEISCDPVGACCNTRFGTCAENVSQIDCQDLNLNWIQGETCNDQNCPDPFIPTVSEWGLVILTLLLLIVAKIYFNRRLSSTQAIRVPPTRGDATP